MELCKRRRHFLHVDPEGGFTMKKLSFASTALAAGALAALSCIAPVQAAPVRLVPVSTSPNIEMVQYKTHAWHGYQGSRTERRGTRRHSDGYWYPLAAFGVDTGSTGSIGTRPAAAAPVQRQRPAYCQSTFGGTNGDGSMPCDNGY
jgi:hypothetical protein